MFKRVTLFFSCTVFLLSAAPQRDVAFLLQHADFELKNPLLFQEGLYDLALVFEHGLYRDDPVLERKFINLVRYAQRRGEHCSGDALIALEDLSERVFSAYRGTRYALDLGFVRSKNMTHCLGDTVDTSLVLEKKEKASKKRHAKKVDHEQKQEVSLLDWWGCNNAYRSRSSRIRGTSKKKATTRKAKTSRPKKERVKKMTKKEKAALESIEKDALIQNISGTEQPAVSDVTLDVAVKPTRKKQTRQKKETVSYSDDARGAMEISEAKPKRKRASKKKEASDL